MVIALNFVFDIIVAILVYEYFKRDKKIEAFAAAVIIKVAYFLSSTVIMGQFNFIGFIIYILVMICVARLYIIIVQEIYKTELHPVLFKLITLFAATFQYTLDKIS